MQSELATRRRVLRVTYRRYIEADRAWRDALDDMRAWFPKSAQPNRAAIGNPGSEIRRLYEERDRAIVSLETAHQKLETARARLDARSRSGMAGVLLMV